MKKSIGYIIFLFCLINLYSLKAQDWEWVNPKPQGNTLYDVVFINRDTGYAVGEFGTIIKTTDGGKNWETLKSGTDNGLTAICFPDENTGYAFGVEGTILLTKDGGKNWEKQQFPFEPDHGIFLSAFFTDVNTGYAITQEGLILKTFNGGNTWKKIGQTFEPLEKIYFIDENTGFVTGHNGAIYKTVNAGQNWKYVGISFKDNDIFLKSISFADKKTGYILAESFRDDSNIIFKTVDGGDNWEEYYTDFYQEMGESIFFTSSETGYSLGDYIYKTTDGGLSWNLQFDGKILPYRVHGSYFTDSLRGIAVGYNGAIYKTENGGENWFEQRKSITDKYIDLNSVYFIDSLTGFAAGGDWKGIIIKTTDGGKNWITQFNDSIGYLKSIFFCDKNIGYAVGSSQINNIEKGTVLKTIDGGINWTYLIKNNLLHYNSVYFTSPDTGYVAGSSYIYKTVDGGENWNVSFHDTGIYFNSLFFLNSQIGFACGTSDRRPIILKSIDGGANWIEIKVNIASVFSSVFILNNDTGFAVSNGGGIFRTIDNGNQWEDYGTYSQNNLLKSIQFIENKYGYIVGEQGTIITTNDKGNTWVKQSQQTSWNLNSVYFSNVNHGWAVGQYGTILKYTGKKDTGVYVLNNLKNNDEFILYPNPASNNITIKSEEIIKNISIYNLTGKKILEKEIGVKNTTLNIENLPHGFYIINITYKDRIKSMKLIKQ